MSGGRDWGVSYLQLMHGRGGERTRCMGAGARFRARILQSDAMHGRAAAARHGRIFEKVLTHGRGPCCAPRENSGKSPDAWARPRDRVCRPITDAGARPSFAFALAFAKARAKALA